MLVYFLKNEELVDKILIMVCRLDIPDGRFQEFLKLIQDLRRDGLINSCKVEEDFNLEEILNEDDLMSNENLLQLIKKSKEEIDAGDFYTLDEFKKIAHGE